MGLDAGVYRNRENVKLGVDAEAARIDPRTGEIYFEDPEIDRRHPRKELIALEFRLGNISAVDALRDEVEYILGSGSFINQIVLYSGSHCGDAIPLGKLSGLSDELEAIHRSGKASQLLKVFHDQMEKLISVASIENNPIVFL